MIWSLTNKGDAEVCAMANRHYPRQTPESTQFVGPGCSLVLRIGSPVRAYWVSLYQRPEFVDHAWPGAWLCSAFRNEGGGLSSELVRDAVAATLADWGPAPAEGMITFVNCAEVRHKRDQGRCFRRAGFEAIGHTKKRGLLVLQLLPGAMPAPMLARPPGLLWMAA